MFFLVKFFWTVCLLIVIIGVGAIWLKWIDENFPSWMEMKGGTLPESADMFKGTLLFAVMSIVEMILLGIIVTTWST